MFSPPFRRVLLKSIGLALILIVLIGIGLQRSSPLMTASGTAWAEGNIGPVPHAAWDVLVWVLSIMASLGIITGAVFLMPVVTAFVGSFFVDEIAEQVERVHYPAEPVGRALPFLRAIVEGLKTALLTLIVYLFALPFVLFAGLGLLILSWRTPTCSAGNILSWRRCASTRRRKPRRCAAGIAGRCSSPGYSSRCSSRCRSSTSPRRSSPWR